MNDTLLLPDPDRSSAHDRIQGISDGRDCIESCTAGGLAVTMFTSEFEMESESEFEPKTKEGGINMAVLPSLLRPQRRYLRRHEDVVDPLHRGVSGAMEDLWLNPFVEMQRLAGGFTPPVNIREEDSQMVLTADLPGMTSDDIDVTVRPDGVRITGERKEESETEEGDYCCRESSYGRFDRYVGLPGEVDEEKAEAEFKDGILTVRMPKSEGAKNQAKKISVKGS